MYQTPPQPYKLINVYPGRAIEFNTDKYQIIAAQNDVINRGKYRSHLITIYRNATTKDGISHQLGSIRYVSVVDQPYYATHVSTGRMCATWQEAKRFALTGK